MIKRYEVTLAKDDHGEYVLINNYTPISKKNKIVLKKLMGLTKKLKLPTLEAERINWEL